MKYIIYLIVIALSALCVSTLNADIYSWTDKDGVKHFSNVPPDDADDVNVEFKEYQHDEKADQQRFEVEQEEWKNLIREIEEEDNQAREEARQRAEEAEKNQLPSREQLIQAEKERLQNKIDELEKKPLEYFGSFKNKRIQIGFYKYRLQTLMQDPDKYFKEPVSFEGNVKNAENSGSSD
jgi:Skp family chaperone for outer membrane proteins